MTRWRPVLGFEGRYEVSDGGSVRSIPHTVTRSNGIPCRVAGQVLQQFVSAKGHMTTSIDQRKRRVHRLVLEAFVGPCPPGLQGLHENDVPSDNRLSNLYWGTPGQNMRDRVRNGVHHYSKRTHCKHGHEFTEANTRMYRNARLCRTCYG